MIESPDVTGDSEQEPPAVHPVDLRRAEGKLVADTGTDFTEAKEAIVDALLRLTERKCTGAGDEGEIIYGARPSSQLVSGFLLPRFDPTGQEDETSDIHIATMGIDLQVGAGESGTVVIEPRICVYVRELPTWQDISDPRHDMMPQVQLSREARQLVEQRARQYIDERVADLPPTEEFEDQERASDAVARAQEARELAEATEQSQSDSEADDPESRGTARAIADAAERAERAASAHQAEQRRRAAARQERIAAIAEIRREAFDRAFEELGIRIVASEENGGVERAVTADDLEELPQSEVVEAGIEDSEAEVESSPDQETFEEGPPPAFGAVGALRQGAGHINDHFAAPQPIPHKWRRLSVELGEFRFDVADESSREAAAAEFEQRFHEQLDATISRWLDTDQGSRDAYRPNERVLPSQFANEASWESFLSGLRERRPAALADVRPDLRGVHLIADLDPDFADPSRSNLRIAIQNDAAMPSGQDRWAFEHAVFQVRLRATVPTALHRPLQLDRIEPSYRFRDWLEYPAMGLNCGVVKTTESQEAISLQTTWAPRYTQPRIDPRVIEGVPTSYRELASPDTDIARLLALPDAYDAWIDQQSAFDAGQGLGDDYADEERRSHTRDLDAYRRESKFIRAGIELLRKSREAALILESGPSGNEAERRELERRSTPWRAWLLTNETFFDYGQSLYTDWRLFQLAFILAHIPTLASRIEEFGDEFDPFRDEISASLLYFATGGGKSEAFFGLLIFNMFFDRLRGKNRGVTALVRYPLRLLTLQQARRLTRVLVHAELVRLRHKIVGWPFELGFWVGSGNTPNRAAQGFGGVPAITVASHADDTALLNPPDGSTDAAIAARRRSARYKEALEAYDKLRVCPCCGAETGMRKYPAQHGRIGIVCFNDESCDWNRANPASPHRVPLPFLLTDDTIYQRAPSVVLGTIDKLALIGQHDRTINALVGMFGAARYMDPHSRHLYVPRGSRALAKAEDDGWIRLQPAFSDGTRVFHDPFPSLVIQDEGHLLDESLGTFSGLFETTLERILLTLGEGLLRDSTAKWPAGEGNSGRPRLAKVIAATATISDPDRQLRVLYQREPLRFPCPGPNLYESFYAAPRQPRRQERQQFASELPSYRRPEEASPRMRTYVSMMTNGRSHTMTTSAVVSAYHLAFTRLWQLLQDGRSDEVFDQIADSLSPDDPLSPVRAQALTELLSRPDGANCLATLLDLLRISLTYVTNKKGGDQIIETLAAQVDRDQRSDGINDLPFVTDLISGGVTIAEIQDVMSRAEGEARPGAEFENIGTSLRNIVATSAISHGVDVDKFNAMFFAGLPADIAEYIQASSRVGRTHVGFSLLVPTPHSRRDRYVVETHDQFHRFLERMIPPPAVQRWADRAIRRIVPSILQAYLCGVVEQEGFGGAPDSDKGTARTFTTAAAIKAWADRHPGEAYRSAVRAVTDFALEAIGVDGRGDSGIGAATHADHYRQFVEDRVRELMDVFTQRSDPSQLSSFWQSIETRTLRRPMTSLRDVDAGGVILGAVRDPYRRRNVHLESVRQVMKIIRGQRMAVRSDLDADPAPLDVEDR